jgi:hypothetical protein
MMGTDRDDVSRRHRLTGWSSTRRCYIIKLRSLGLSKESRMSGGNLREFAADCGEHVRLDQGSCQAQPSPHVIQPRSWNLILSCSEISSAVALALPSSAFLPLISP